MVDFRYHALSLVAVFLALGIGIVLGVTVGDSLVSEADQNLRDSLRDDVTEAREDVRNEQDARLEARRGDRRDGRRRWPTAGCAGMRVALVALGELPGDGRGLRRGGGRPVGDGDLARTAVLDPPDCARRAQRPAPAAARQRASAGWSRAAGRRRGGCATGEPRRFSGSYRGPVEAVVVYRNPPAEADDDEAARDLELREAFEDGLFKGLRDNVVGVEALEHRPVAGRRGTTTR